MSIKSKLRASARRKLGLDLSRFPGPNDLDGQVVAAIDAHAIDTAVDVGANEGQFGASLRALGYRGRILSFEPLPAAYAALTERAAGDPMWQTFNLGLGQEPGWLPLNVSASTDMSSLLPINDNYLSRLPERGQVTERVEVEIATLDSLDLPGSRLLVKTDTQGYDVRVLRGGAQTLERAHALLMELALIPNYDGADNEWRAALDLVDELGFEPAGFFAIGRDQHRRIREMDGLFVRVAT